jgi:hypothetical protein
MAVFWYAVGIVWLGVEPEPTEAAVRITDLKILATHEGDFFGDHARVLDAVQKEGAALNAAAFGAKLAPSGIFRSAQFVRGIECKL